MPTPNIPHTTDVYRVPWRAVIPTVAIGIKLQTLDLEWRTGIEPTRVYYVTQAVQAYEYGYNVDHLSLSLSLSVVLIGLYDETLTE